MRMAEVFAHRSNSFLMNNVIDIVKLHLKLPTKISFKVALPLERMLAHFYQSRASGFTNLLQSK
mgnify:CR=1 FL=1